MTVGELQDLLHYFHRTDEVVLAIDDDTWLPIKEVQIAYTVGKNIAKIVPENQDI